MSESLCDVPVAKNKVNFPNDIIGRANVSYDTYSGTLSLISNIIYLIFVLALGYVNVTTEDWLFYWFFPSADGNPDAPLIIWTNGK
jgi:carboxypeptidase C (cathepsin A)